MLVHAEWLLLRADRYRRGQRCAGVDVAHARTKQARQAEAASSAPGVTKRDAGRERQTQQAADKRTCLAALLIVSVLIRSHVDINKSRCVQVEYMWNRCARLQTLHYTVPFVFSWLHKYTQCFYYGCTTSQKCIFNTHNIHPPIHLSRIRDCGGAGAYPCWLRVQGRVHPG